VIGQEVAVLTVKPRRGKDKENRTSQMSGGTMIYELVVGLDYPQSRSGYFSARKMFSASSDTEAIRLARAAVPKLARGWPILDQHVYHKGRLVKDLAQFTPSEMAVTARWGLNKSWKIFWQSGLVLIAPVATLGLIGAVWIVTGTILTPRELLLLGCASVLLTALISLAPLGSALKAFVLRKRRYP
jgi:hypothetical protein